MHPSPDGRVTVVGAGSWGTTVAALLAASRPVTLWARDPALSASLAATRQNPRYLPGLVVPDGLAVTCDLVEAVAGAGVVVMAVPSAGFRTVLEAAAPHLAPGASVVSLAKGLEPGSRLRMSEVVREVAPDHPVAVLTGPNLAGEIAAGQPAASVLAAEDEAVARALQPVFHSSTLRVYTNTDVVGCEMAGVVKNVIAIAAGIVEGLGYGDNTKAAVMTRGLAELTRLGVAMGGDPRTSAGLAGMGDLVATCMSDKSRNHNVGVQLGRGHPLSEIEASTPMIAEGIRSSAVVCELATSLGVEMPLAEQVRGVCHDGADAAGTVPVLMGRAPTAE